ncbi:hypothetical protein SAMN05444320_10611 [Streptoalloteichus hindustanus]|uniref:Uncharacterized protein n=1 Tax=Streptoalloteichus hindustanus TaxID=2017 RepID=A0A1M5G936_STRHI|nr:hypothetical protein SAMN05444320_10611 [Streptoalloteichus hindustanus]
MCQFLPPVPTNYGRPRGRVLVVTEVLQVRRINAPTPALAIVGGTGLLAAEIARRLPPGLTPPSRGAGGSC